MSTARLGAPNHMLHGEHVCRVVSRLGSDDLVGYCWCGAEHDSQDPVEVWTWLWSHDPSGAGPHPATEPTPPPQGPHRHPGK